MGCSPARPQVRIYAPDIELVDIIVVEENDNSSLSVSESSQETNNEYNFNKIKNKVEVVCDDNDTPTYKRKLSSRNFQFLKVR